MSDAQKARAGIAVWAVVWKQAAAIEDNVELVLRDLEAIVTETDITGDGTPNATTVAGGLHVAEEAGGENVAGEDDELVFEEAV
jgi:hypothetical protein